MNVTISNGVTSIGNYAFQLCGLTNASLPDSLIDIGDFAFAGCGGLIGLTIPGVSPTSGTVLSVGAA
jgi:hypothetical protein